MTLAMVRPHVYISSAGRSQPLPRRPCLPASMNAFPNSSSNPVSGLTSGTPAFLSTSSIQSIKTAWYAGSCKLDPLRIDPSGFLGNLTSSLRWFLPVAFSVFLTSAHSSSAVLPSNSKRREAVGSITTSGSIPALLARTPNLFSYIPDLFTELVETYTVNRFVYGERNRFVKERGPVTPIFPERFVT